MNARAAAPRAGRSLEAKRRGPHTRAVDFTEVATAFTAEVVWDEPGTDPAPRGFTIHRPGRPDVAVEAEMEGGTCVAARFSVERPGTGALPKITLRREGRLDRGGKALRINREVQLGDARFDAAVYILTTASDTTVQQALARAEARAAVTAVLQGVSSELVLGGGRITARVEGAHLHDHAALRVVIDYLAYLRDTVAVPKDISTASLRAVRRRPVRVAGLVTLWLALAGLALALRPPPVLTWGPVLMALAAGALLALVCCALVVTLLQGRADSLRWSLIGSACFVPLAPFAGMQLALTLNASLDDAPAVERVHPVAAMEDHGDRVTLEVDGLADADARTRLSVPKARIRGELPSEPGPVVFEVKPGAFGWPWLAAVAVAAPGPDVVKRPPDDA